jgi:PAS domain S-box-containing protein
VASTSTSRAGEDADLPAFWSSSLDLLAISDVDGRFVRVNPAWARILGYAEDELVGTSYVSLVEPHERALVGAAVAASIDELGEIRDFTTRLRGKDGTYRAFLWRTSVRGELVYAIGREVASPGTSEAHEPLSKRELEVLTLTAGGHSRGEIARRLHLSIRTVETHRARIQQKLGLGSRAALVEYALSRGLLAPPRDSGTNPSSDG